MMRLFTLLMMPVLVLGAVLGAAASLQVTSSTLQSFTFAFVPPPGGAVVHVAGGGVNSGDLTLQVAVNGPGLLMAAVAQPNFWCGSNPPAPPGCPLQIIDPLRTWTAQAPHSGWVDKQLTIFTSYEPVARSGPVVMRGGEVNAQLVFAPGKTSFANVAENDFKDQGSINQTSASLNLAGAAAPGLFAIALPVRAGQPSPMGGNALLGPNFPTKNAVVQWMVNAGGINPHGATWPTAAQWMICGGRVN